MGIAGRSGLRLAVVCLVVVGLCACRDLQAASEAFPGSSPSLEALGAGALEALSTGDVDRLESFRLTESEHNEQVWPELPAAAPEVHFPVELAWANIDTRDRAALVRILPFYRSNATTYRATECRGDVQRFETFSVLTDCWVMFTLADDSSRILEAQIFKDVIVRGGGHKIFRYYDENPRNHVHAEAD